MTTQLALALGLDGSHFSDHTVRDSLAEGDLYGWSTNKKERYIYIMSAIHGEQSQTLNA